MLCSLATTIMLIKGSTGTLLETTRRGFRNHPDPDLSPVFAVWSQIGSHVKPFKWQDRVRETPKQTGTMGLWKPGPSEESLNAPRMTTEGFVPPSSSCLGLTALFGSVCVRRPPIPITSLGVWTVGTAQHLARGSLVRWVVELVMAVLVRRVTFRLVLEGLMDGEQKKKKGGEKKKRQTERNIWNKKSPLTLKLRSWD